MSKKSLMHSIKMHDATDLMPRLMIIHSTADMYAARRRNVSQLRKTLDSTHALEVLRYQSALYAAVRKVERKSVFDTLYATLTKTGSGNKAIAVYRDRVNKAHADKTSFILTSFSWSMREYSAPDDCVTWVAAFRSEFWTILSF
jgi:hypothetical protein